MPYLLAAMSVALLFMANALFLGPPIFGLDDAYITLHDAQVLWRGIDVAYPGTPALVGSTSPIHTLIVAALLPFSSPVWALEISLWIGVLLYALGIVHLARKTGANGWQTALLLFVGFAINQTAHQLVNGLETGLTLAGLTWAIALYDAERPNRSTLVICGLLPFLRPELLVFSLSVLAVQLYRRSKNTDAIKHMGFDIATVLLAAVPFAILVKANTGSFVPSTIGAKAAFFAEATLPISDRFQLWADALKNFSAGIGLLAIAALFLWRSAIGRTGLAFMAVFLAAYLLKFPGALSHYHQRYLYVFVPFLLFGVAESLRLAPRWSRWSQILLVATAFQSLIFAPYWWSTTHLAGLQFGKQELEGVADWSNANIPRGSKILVHDAGYMAFATDFRLCDLVGLKTPAAVKYHQQITLPSAGKNRPFALALIARQTNPDYLIVLDDWDRIFGITAGLRDEHWRLDLVRPIGAYKVYRLTAP